jgi:uncharacterized membrane protein
VAGSEIVSRQGIRDKKQKIKLLVAHTFGAGLFFAGPLSVCNPVFTALLGVVLGFLATGGLVAEALRFAVVVVAVGVVGVVVSMVVACPACAGAAPTLTSNVSLSGRAPNRDKD